jgi:photosystem II stability/assembly factor-like uncharacterized protein
LSYWALTCLSVDPELPERIYAGTEHSGLFYSEDAGSRWLRANPNVPKMMLFCVLALPGTVMVGTVPSALYRKDNGGWRELTGVRAHSSSATFPPSPELQSRTRYITPDPADGNRLYAGIEVGGMLVSRDGGANWDPANNGLTDMDVHEILASRQTPGLVLAACGEKVFRSMNRAEHWEEITPSTHDYGMSVAEDRNGVIYLGSATNRPNTWIRESGAEAAIFRTTDAGTTWQPVVQNLRGGVMHMCAAPNTNGVIAATSDGTLLAVDESGARTIASGLPCITAVELGA